MIEVEKEQIQECISKYGYKFEELIGYSSSSSVSLCQSLKCQQRFAIKRATKQNISADEYKTLASLSHPNIVSLYDAFEDEDSQYLVMEYCNNGTIRQKSNVSYEKFVHYAKQAVEALAYCHANKIAHRNIKPDNIFIDQYDNIKLGDFGFAKQFDNLRKSSEKCQSMIYSAPEILQHQKIDPFKADIWALGITFFFMALGTYPFKNKSIEELRNAIIFGELDFGNQKIDPQIRFLINKMTTKNPYSRPTADKILKYPIFTASILPKKPNLLAACGRRNSYTIGMNSSTNFFLNKSMTFEQNQCDTQTDENKPILLMDVHCFRSVAVHPNIQKVGNRYPFAKPI